MKGKNVFTWDLARQRLTMALLRGFDIYLKPPCPGLARKQAAAATASATATAVATAREEGCTHKGSISNRTRGSKDGKAQIYVRKYFYFFVFATKGKSILKSTNGLRGDISRNNGRVESNRARLGQPHELQVGVAVATILGW